MMALKKSPSQGGLKCRPPKPVGESKPEESTPPPLPLLLPGGDNTWRARSMDGGRDAAGPGSHRPSAPEQQGPPRAPPCPRPGLTPHPFPPWAEGWAQAPTFQEGTSQGGCQDVSREPYRGDRFFTHVGKLCWKVRASTVCRPQVLRGRTSSRQALLPRGTRVMERLLWGSLQCWKVPVPESMGTDTEVVLSTQNSRSPASGESPFSFPGEPERRQEGRVG